MTTDLDRLHRSGFLHDDSCPLCKIVHCADQFALEAREMFYDLLADRRELLDRVRELEKKTGREEGYDLMIRSLRIERNNLESRLRAAEEVCDAARELENGFLSRKPGTWETLREKLAVYEKAMQSAALDEIARIGEKQRALDEEEA